MSDLEARLTSLRGRLIEIAALAHRSLGDLDTIAYCSPEPLPFDRRKLRTLAVIGPAILLSGAALPLLFHHLRQRFGELGAAAGSLYSWNTLGSLTGAPHRSVR